MVPRMVFPFLLVQNVILKHLSTMMSQQTDIIMKLQSGIIMI